MAIDYPSLFQGLGAMAMAFADPRQSLLMSQGVHQNLEAARERKRREAAQAAQLAENTRRWQAEQDVRSGGLALKQQQYVDSQRALQAGQQQVASLMGGQPMMQPAISNQVLSAVSGPGGAPGMALQGLRPGLFSGRAGPPSPYPQAFQQAVMMRAQTDPAGAAKMLSDYQQSEAERIRKANEPTAMERNAQAWMDMSPEERSAFADYRRQLGGGVNVEVNTGAAPRQQGPAWSNVYGEPDKGNMWLYDPDNSHKMLTRTDPVSGVTYETPVQVSRTTKAPTSEETRGLALSRTVLEEAGEFRELLKGFDATNRANYAASGLPMVGRFFSNTEGGDFKSRVDSLITNSLYLVSGAEAPPRELEARIRTYAPQPWDSPQRINEKLDRMVAVAENMQAFRLNKGLDRDAPIPEADVARILETTNQQMESTTGVPAPPAATPPRGFSYSGYDEEKGAHVYLNEAGELRYWK